MLAAQIQEKTYEQYLDQLATDFAAIAEREPLFATDANLRAPTRVESRRKEGHGARAT